jgi:hypothetical protein
MDTICAALLSLACLGAAPSVDGPLGVTPHVAGRFGVVSVRSGGTTVTEPYALVRAGLTWRHELDSGARVAVSFEVVGAAPQGLRLR